MHGVLEGHSSPLKFWIPSKVIRFLSSPLFKVGPLSSKKKYFICVTESPLKMMKNAYLILKALFVLEIFKCLYWLFGHIEKTA